MPIGLNNGRAQGMSKVASHSYSRLLTMPIPIVPITSLFNVVVIRSKGVLGTYKRIYTRKSLNRLGTVMGTRRFLCAKN